MYYADVTIYSITKACTDLLSAKINNTQFNVTRKETSNERSGNAHPKFHRVRTVTIGNGRIVCNCSFSPDNSLTCVHVLHVEFLDDTYEGPKRRDVSVVWWKDYLKYGFNMHPDDNENLDIKKF